MKTEQDDPIKAVLIKPEDGQKQELIDESKLNIPVKFECITPHLITYPINYVQVPYYQLNVNPIPYIPQIN